MLAADAYEDARRTVQAFINAPDANCIVFTRSTTESINTIASGLSGLKISEADNILITEAEHHTNLLPWKAFCARTGASLRVVTVDDTGAVSLEAFQAQLTPRTKIAAFSHISNVLGSESPVKGMIAAARNVGAITVVDGAQAVAHVPVDVTDLDADFYCFSAHKMYGPMGIGVLYGKHDLLDCLTPALVGGGSAKIVGLDARPTKFVPVPHRLEAGTPNIAGAVGLAAAIAYLNEFGMENVSAHDQALVDVALDALSSIKGVNVLTPAGGSKGLVTFIADGLHPYDIGNHLNSLGIATRTGVHCAIPMTDRLGVVGTTRASFGIYNNASEVHLFAEALASVKPGFWSEKHMNDRFLETTL